nr:transcription termination/antitermination NusG family protein [Candidatus Dependentiae bacterium]
MKRWYVTQVYAGYEEPIKKDLMRRIKEESLEDLFGEILIPSVKLKQFFAVEEEQDEQLFPGYILIEMEL